MAAFFSLQIIADLLDLPNDARRYCKEDPSGLPAQVYYDNAQIDESLLLPTARFHLLRKFGLSRSMGDFAFFLEFLLFNFSYQIAYFCLVLQLLCVVWVRETKWVAILSTLVASISAVPLLQFVFFSTLTGYRDAVVYLRATKTQLP